MPLGIKPTVDFAFKKIFGSPENIAVLIGLLNAILKLPRPIVDVEILNPFSYQEFADEKQIVLDIRARDSAGRWLNIEMQVTVLAGLLKRLVYYACSLYANQLQSGGDYADLRPAISICLLRNVLFRDSDVPHHRFRLVDDAQGRVLEETVEVHTVELTKYNVDEQSLANASAIEKWVFFLLYADQYEPERLRELLAEEPFQRAISATEAIAGRTEDRTMYDQREKAQRDYQWALESARREGLEKGLEKGREEGLEKGLEKGLERGALVGKIQLLEQLLGAASNATESLPRRSTEELTTLLSNLQQRLRSRSH